MPLPSYQGKVFSLHVYLLSVISYLRKFKNTFTNIPDISDILCRRLMVGKRGRAAILASRAQPQVAGLLSAAGRIIGVSDASRISIGAPMPDSHFLLTSSLASRSRLLLFAEDCIARVAERIFSRRLGDVICGQDNFSILCLTLQYAIRREIMSLMRSELKGMAWSKKPGPMKPS